MSFKTVIRVAFHGRAGGVLTAEIIPNDNAAKQRVIEVLKEGGVAILPTEFSYGFAVSGTIKKAVGRVYILKARDGWKPLPLLATPALAQEYAEVPDDLAALLPRFWPGGIAFVLPRKEAVPQFVSDRDTIMLYCPDAWSYELADEAGFPIARTSANLTNEPPLTDAAAAAKQFGEMVDLIVDGGPARIAQPTTIVDLTEEKPTILREGWVPAAEVRRLFGDVAFGEAP